MNKQPLPIFKILMLDQAKAFMRSLSADVTEKIEYNLNRVLSGNYDKTIFKKLTGHEIWELRTKYKGQAYRLFAFFDKYTGNLVVATHGIVKKTQKVPLHEIRKAEKIMKQYYLDNYPDKK